MKIISWNVNSVRARINNILEYIKQDKPDILLIQEIKTQDEKFPYDEFESVLKPYANAEELLWCQEEPKNQGAWFITRRRLMKSKSDQMRLLLSSRPASAAPAAGYKSMHVQQQRELVEAALGIENKESDPEVQ